MVLDGYDYGTMKNFNSNEVVVTKDTKLLLQQNTVGIFVKHMDGYYVHVEAEKPVDDHMVILNALIKIDIYLESKKKFEEQEFMHVFHAGNINKLQQVNLWED